LKPENKSTKGLKTMFVLQESIKVDPLSLNVTREVDVPIEKQPGIEVTGANMTYGGRGLEEK